jgi:hypothetical protein
VQDQHYSLYARRGYGLWNLLDESRNSVAAFQTMDQRMRYLEQATRRGPFATEPFVTDEIEFGGSEETRLIAEVMFNAQIKRFKETGFLTAVSESPADQSPWFTYQGFEPNAEEQWPVHLPRGMASSVADLSALRLQSSKASFLWSATRPGEYSQNLLERVRAKAKSVIGFASGIYETTHIATNVTDINTNALILESIAFALLGREPLLQAES